MSDFIHVETPESVDLTFEPVGVGSRFLAAFLDSLILGSICLATLIVGLFLLGALDVAKAPKLLTGSVSSILLVLVGILFTGYKLLFEAIWNGQTLGKRLVGIRVVQENGLPVEFAQVLVRHLLRLVDFLPSLYFLGVLCILASRRGQRLGDMVAGTVVVRERPAPLPVVPVHLGHAPVCQPERLQEYVRRLREGDLHAARAFLARRKDLQPAHRHRLSQDIARRLAQQMGWPDPLPTVSPHPEFFIEEVLYVRAQPAAPRTGP